jgi:hypothetical protein
MFVLPHFDKLSTGAARGHSKKNYPADINSELTTPNSELINNWPKFYTSCNKKRIVRSFVL